MSMILYEVAHSTNVERVELALGHKGLNAERVRVPFDERELIVQVSGQELVPVLDHDGEIICDSTRIIDHLEERFPETPSLYPPERRADAEVRLFVDWFNRTWKREPNLITAELEKGEAGNQLAIARWGRRMAQRRDWFEALLSDREYLFGLEITVADVIAWPFLRFAAATDEGDPHLFHEVCHRYQPLTGETPHLARWIERIAAHPKATASVSEAV